METLVGATAVLFRVTRPVTPPVTLLVTLCYAAVPPGLLLYRPLLLLLGWFLKDLGGPPASISVRPGFDLDRVAKWVLHLQWLEIVCHLEVLLGLGL
jgi:hypothetical protein